MKRLFLSAFLAWLAASPAFASSLTLIGVGHAASSGGGGWVSFDATTTASHGWGQTITSNALTISSCSKSWAKIDLETWNVAQDPPGLTCTIGAATATLIGSANASASGDASLRSYVLGVVAPPSGSQTATCSWSTNNYYLAINVSSYCGVNQTTPTVNFTSNTASNTTPTITITNASGAIATDAVDSNAATITSPTCTSVATDQAGHVGIAVSRSSSVNPTCSWTGDTSGPWVETGVSVQP